MLAPPLRLASPPPLSAPTPTRPPLPSTACRFCVCFDDILFVRESSLKLGL